MLHILGLSYLNINRKATSRHREAIATIYSQKRTTKEHSDRNFIFVNKQYPQQRGIFVVFKSFTKLTQAKTPQSSPVFSKAVTPKWTGKSSSNIKLEEVQQHCSQNRSESIDKLDRKRKRSLEAEGSGKSIEKRARVSLSDNVIECKEGASDINIEKDSSIEYWRKTGNWPKKSFEPDPNMSQLVKKRSSSAMSYSQGVREGEYPPAHTPAYEKRVLEPAGIILDQQLGEADISDDCKQLCATLADAQYEPPSNSLFEKDLFWKVLNRVRSRSESRVVRDISPLLIPSVEVLFMRGISNLEHLTEEIQAD